MQSRCRNTFSSVFLLLGVPSLTHKVSSPLLRDTEAFTRTRTHAHGHAHTQTHTDVTLEGVNIRK